MTDRRASLTIPIAALAITGAMTGAIAFAAEPAPADEPAPPAAAPAAAPDAAPTSPAEEEAQRAARLDALFIQLARPGNPAWEGVQSDIRAMWSQSGSAAMDLLLARATDAIEAENLDLALRFLNDLVRLAPDFAEAWNRRATVHFLRGDYGRSVADIQRALALEPRHFGAIYGLATILERTGDKKGALTAYRRCLEINPNLPGAREAVDRLAPDIEGREL